MIKKKLNINDVFLLAAKNHHKNNYKVAAKLYAEILKVDSNHTRTINNLASLLGENKLDYITQIDRASAKELLLFLFRRNDIDHKDLFLISRFLLFSEKNLNQSEIQKIIGSNSLILKNKIVQNFFKDELFLLILQKTLIVDHSLEKILTKLRQEILFTFVESKQNLLKEIYEFIISLSEQCFLNEYVYFQEKKEIHYLNQLEKSIKKNEKIDEIKMAILGCYLPLHNSDKIKNTLLNYKSKNILFNDLITMQIKEPLEEKKIMNSIPSHGKISNPVSKKVRRQYEQNPYPRWRYTYSYLSADPLAIINNLIKPNKIELDKKLNNPNILIAGCGTGKQILQSKVYLNANILGVDLSLSSLAYAKRKTEELGLKNIKFLHSDILELKNLNKKFDIIECAGVLHHMEDPTAGMKVLKDLLEPHGLLRLGLYSELARQDIVKVRSFIKKNKFKDTIDDIRKCRKVITDKKSDKLFNKISYRKDFFSTSSVRDLMFHVQEHRFDLKQLEKILKDLNFEFLGFTDLSTKIKFFKLFPNDKKNTLLNNWNQFEIKYPDTFNGMYSFLVKKGKN